MSTSDLMSKIDITVETAVSTSMRARQVSAMFDVPASKKCSLSWSLDFPYDAEPWNVGLIVGPSGSGKSTVLRHVWGDVPALNWAAPSMLDDFRAELKTEQITDACGAVGFNTIPAWLRPFRVLSNGEQFRADLARRMVELPDPIIVDEYTSVVDRQVAQIGSHAVQKYVRRHGRKFVAVGCHYDVIDWLQPDWVLDMATNSFTRRVLQRRPKLDVVVGRVPIASWSMFAPFHYMSASLHRSARCFGIWCGGKLAAFVGMMNTVHPSKKAQNIMRVSRAVTLPDFQGVGLYMFLVETLGQALASIGKRLRQYPGHPALVRILDRSPSWELIKQPGTFGSNASATSTHRNDQRPCAVFEFVGRSSMTERSAHCLLGF